MIPAMTTRRQLLVVAAGVLALAACGGGDDDDSDATTAGTTATADTDAPETTGAAPTTTAAPATTTATTEPGINSFDQVQPAVIQILATGTMRDPEVGMTTMAGSGSGFIISPDGLALTNNHVVTGAATLEVFIGGDETESYNASIVGVSECNDLALIRIANAEDLPTLTWQDEDSSVGQEIYAAGFPLGDPEFTLTRGIVAKAQAAGDTPWASIDHTLEHDANIQPGNSGGPLVSADGKVVGVNYASNSATNTSQFFAIDSALAQDVVDELQNGDFESLGINGSAVLDEEAGISGVWVSGVAPGSPVDKAGVLPGDIVTALNGLPLASDGTMKDYCDVLRTSGPDRPIQIEVLRYDTEEVLRGELNTDTPIEPVFSFAEEVGDVDTATATGYSGYQTLVDDTGAITVDVPNEWTDIDTAPFTMDDGSQAPFISAATDLAAFNDSWDVPGLFYAALPPQPDIAGTIALVAPQEGQCTTDNGVTDYDDSVFTGQYQYWSGCGGNNAEYVVLVANPADASYTAVIAVQILSDADWEALDQAFATFNVVTE
jgi:serine protease Do